MRNFAPRAPMETPWQRAKQIWDNRLGKAWREGHYWMWACFGMLGLLVWVEVQNKRIERARAVHPIEIFYVAMDANGIGTVLGKAPLQTTPGKAAMEARLRRFIAVTRGKLLDQVAVGRVWREDAYNWVTPRAAVLLNEWAQERQAVLRSPKVSVAVDITRVLIKPDGSYDVWWTETKRDHNNNREETTYFTGTYTLTVDTPKNEKQLMANETGVFVDYFAVTKAK